MAEVALDFLHGELVAHFCRDFIQSAATSAAATGATAEREEAVREAVSRLESVGFDAGYRLTERLTLDMARFRDELDAVKYICKDFWEVINRKKIDNLRTNNQGVYVLQDNRCRFLLPLCGASSSTSGPTSGDAAAGAQYLSAGGYFLAFMCGLVRGALAALGLRAVVTAEVTHLPLCKFHIQMQR